MKTVILFAALLPATAFAHGGHSAATGALHWSLHGWPVVVAAAVAIAAIAAWREVRR